VLGNSSSLGPGSHENVTVALDEPLEETTTTVNVTVHRDTDVDERFDFTSTAGSVDGPYLNETGEPVTVPVELDVDAGPEPGVAYLNCTTAQVDGSYDRLGVTLGLQRVPQRDERVRLDPVDVPTDRPVDGQTLVTVGEQNETTVTEDGTLVIQIADPGVFGEDNRSFVANVNTSASPTGQENLSVAQPNTEQCRDDVRPELPTLASGDVDVVDNETALVNFSYENSNDAPMEPAESQFTSGDVAGEPPAVLDVGQNFVVVEWTPESTEESVTWTLNLSNFDLLERLVGRADRR